MNCIFSVIRRVNPTTHHQILANNFLSQAQTQYATSETFVEKNMPCLVSVGYFQPIRHGVCSTSDFLPCLTLHRCQEIQCNAESTRFEKWASQTRKQYSLGVHNFIFRQSMIQDFSQTKLFLNDLKMRRYNYITIVVNKNKRKQSRKSPGGIWRDFYA